MLSFTKPYNKQQNVALLVVHLVGAQKVREQLASMCYRGFGKSMALQDQGKKTAYICYCWDSRPYPGPLIKTCKKTPSQMLVSITHKYTFVNFAMETIFHSHQQSPPKTMACIVTMWQDFFWTDGGGFIFVLERLFQSSLKRRRKWAPILPFMLARNVEV